MITRVFVVMPLTKERRGVLEEDMTRSLQLLIVTLCLLSPNFAAAYSLRHAAAGALLRWYTPSIALRVDPALEAVLPAGQVRSALAMASDAWHGIGDAPELVVAQGAPDAYDPERRNNAVYLLREWPFGADQLAVTVLSYAKSGQIVGVDVLVNGSKRFEMLSENEAAADVDAHDFAAVMTHELGHVLGLDEDRDDEQATMWPYIRKGDTRQRTLSDDDERGIIAAYNELPAVVAAPACTASAALGARSAHGALVLALMLLMARARSRSPSGARARARRAAPRYTVC
jgi:hypothetical protein